MKLYLSGQISPTPRWLGRLLPGWRRGVQRKNAHRFYLKANELRDLGHEVLNPVESESTDGTWVQFLAEDLSAINDFKPDAIYMMKGWEKSGGARLEREYCIRENIAVIYERG